MDQEQEQGGHRGHRRPGKAWIHPAPGPWICISSLGMAACRFITSQSVQQGSFPIKIKKASANFNNVVEVQTNLLGY
eukprot:gene15790-biopygen4399